MLRKYGYQSGFSIRSPIPNRDSGSLANLGHFEGTDYFRRRNRFQKEPIPLEEPIPQEEQIPLEEPIPLEVRVIIIIVLYV